MSRSLRLPPWQYLGILRPSLLPGYHGEVSAHISHPGERAPRIQAFFLLSEQLRVGKHSAWQTLAPRSISVVKVAGDEG